MEIRVLVQLRKSKIFSSTSFPVNKTFGGVGSAAIIEHSRVRANMVAKEDEKFYPETELSIEKRLKFLVLTFM